MIDLFDADPRKLPKSANEIRNRLRQVDVALELQKYCGKRVVAASPSSSDQCEILKCTVHTATLLKLNNNFEFTIQLRKASFEAGDYPKLSFE